MIKSILIVTNENKFTESTKKEILQTVNLIIDSGKEVHIFKEDLLLYNLLRDNENIQYIEGLSSGADKLLFNRLNENFYNSTDKVSKVKTNFSDVYKRAISRNTSPDRSMTFDEKEYNTLRESIMFRRLKFAISKIADEYTFVINFLDRKDVNYLNNIKPEYGDGKFFYLYDCIKERSEFVVGGCPLPHDNFIQCIKEG